MWSSTGAHLTGNFHLQSMIFFLRVWQYVEGQDGEEGVCMVLLSEWKPCSVYLRGPPGHVRLALFNLLKHNLTGALLSLFRTYFNWSLAQFI